MVARFPARPRRGLCRRGVSFLALSILLSPSPAHAIPAPDWEGPDGVHYSEWNIANHPLACANVIGQVVEADCLGDENQKEMAREETKGLARWVRGGLLLWGQLMAGVDIAKETLHYGKKIVSYVEGIAHGFNMTRPSATAVRLAGASDRIDFMMDGAQRIGMQDEFGRVERYNEIDALVMRALSVGKDADLVSVQLSDQAFQTQLRLAPSGRVNVYEVEDGGTGMRDLDMPPLPEDAPPGVLAAAAAPALPRTAASSGPLRLSADAQAVLARAGNESGSSTYGACAVPEDSQPESQTTFYRAMEQETGSQLASTAAVADITQVNEQLKAIAAQEEALEHESWFIALLHSWRL